AVGPAAAEQRDLVAAGREPFENLVKVDFRAACQRVFPILPVDDEDLHRSRPIRRASASSTPFTKRALCSLPNRSASRTAACRTTRGGVTPACSSAAPRRSTQRSI